MLGWRTPVRVGKGLGSSQGSPQPPEASDQQKLNLSGQGTQPHRTRTRDHIWTQCSWDRICTSEQSLLAQDRLPPCCSSLPQSSACSQAPLYSSLPLSPVLLIYCLVGLNHQCVSLLLPLWTYRTFRVSTKQQVCITPLLGELLLPVLQRRFTFVWSAVTPVTVGAAVGQRAPRRMYMDCHCSAVTVTTCDSPYRSSHPLHPSSSGGKATKEDLTSPEVTSPIPHLQGRERSPRAWTQKV